MLNPVQVTFRDMNPSESVRTLCEEEADKLIKVCEDITSCHVTIATPHQHHQKGALHSVHVEVHVPGQKFAAGHDDHTDHTHEDLMTATRDAFRTVRKQIDSWNTKRRDIRRRGHGQD